MSMTELGDAIESGLLELEDLTPTRNLDGPRSAQTFTWKNAEVPCLPSSLRAGQTIAVGGHEEEITLTLFVRRSHFVTADSTLITIDSDLYTVDNDMPTPVAGRKLVFRGKTYRILAAKEPASRSNYELDLGDSEV